MNLIMKYVYSVSYSFIINGGVCRSVTPAHGLRQGDPLSVSLFIMIADAFSKMIHRKVQESRSMELKPAVVVQKSLIFSLQTTVYSLQELSDRNAVLLLIFSASMN